MKVFSGVVLHKLEKMDGGFYLKALLVLFFVLSVPLFISTRVMADDIVIEVLKPDVQVERVTIPETVRPNIPEYSEAVADFNVRGIYVTGWVAGSEQKMRALIELVKKSILNSMVIDVKDQQGILSYHSDVPLAVTIGANGKKIKNIRALLAELKNEGIYTIARITVFKDSLLSKKMPVLALPIWDPATQQITYSRAWVDPSEKRVWDYNISLAREAVRMGFDEIQFDYIRYPAMANSPTKVVLREGMTKSDIINGFVGYARDRLADLNVPISIDVFGLTTTVNDDMGIGQNFAELSNLIGIISPMVYPSHYAQGSYGIKVPEKEPYRVIEKSMTDARKKLADKKGVRVRPWLQDFSLKHEYTFRDVQDQIRAAEEQGIKEWLLWNPRSSYTTQALLRPPH